MNTLLILSFMKNLNKAIRDSYTLDEHMGRDTGYVDRNGRKILIGDQLWVRKNSIEGEEYNNLKVVPFVLPGTFKKNVHTIRTIADDPAVAILLEDEDGQRFAFGVENDSLYTKYEKVV